MRDIKQLHPALQDLVQKLQAECQKEGLPVSITECLRTKQEQDALYAKGRTAPGKIVTKVRYPYSMHCWGVAFDFCRNVKGMEYNDSDGFFGKVGKIGISLGLEWGGSWRGFVDKPHFQIRNYSAEGLIKKYGTPQNFINSWVAINEPHIFKKEEEFEIIMKKINVNGLEGTIDAIQKDGISYIRTRDLANFNFDVGYEPLEEKIKINNRFSETEIDVEGNVQKFHTISINDRNLIKVSDLVKLGYKVLFENGTIKIIK